MYLTILDYSINLVVSHKLTQEEEDNIINNDLSSIEGLILKFDHDPSDCHWIFTHSEPRQTY